MSDSRWQLGPSPATVTAILSLAEAAAQADGVAPFSEATTLALRRLPVEPAERPQVRTLGEPDSLGAALLAPDGSAEVAVHPGARGHGHGGALVDAVLERRPDARLWAHGDLPGAQSIAHSRGLRVIRNLWRMQRAVQASPRIPPGAGDALAGPVVPEGFAARSFVPGQDEQAWLDLNATAFAHHPEQGRMTRDDLHDRMAQPWFDPAGLLLIEAMPQRRLVASHWTKVADPGGTEGEVYVVAVDPAYQGRGLGRAVTALGLAYLARRGVHTIELYVEGDNAAAVATYTRLGFARAAVDVMYSRTVHPGLTP